MAEYIEREALYEKAYWHGEHPNLDNPFPDGVDAIDIKDVDAIPSADVVPVRHGRWIKGGYACGETEWQCSACQETEWRTSASRLKSGCQIQKKTRSVLTDMGI